MEPRWQRLDVSELLDGVAGPAPPGRAYERRAGPFQVRVEQQRFLVLRSRSGEHCLEVPRSIYNRKRTVYYLGKVLLFPLALAGDLATFPFSLLALMALK